MKEIIKKLLELSDNDINNMDLKRIKSVEKIAVPYDNSDSYGVYYTTKVEFFQDNTEG